MKTKFAFILLMTLLLGCGEAGSPVSSVRSLIEPLDIDKTKNIIIFTVNPNDCLNCLIGFKSINEQLTGATNPRVYVVSVEREIERRELEKNITEVDLKPAKNKAVLWSKDDFTRINYQAGITLALSSIIVYNFEKDSVLYSKPIREIGDERELIGKF